MKPVKKDLPYRVGVFVLILLAAGGSFIFLLGKKSLLLGEKATLRAYTQDAGNLRVGAAVNLRGIRVGVVEDLIFEAFNRIRIDFSVEKDSLKLIRRDSKVLVSTMGVMGDKYLEILGGTENSPAVGEGDELPAGDALGPEDLMGKVGKSIQDYGRVMGEVTKAISEINKVTEEVSTLVRDINRQGSLKKSMGHLVKTTQNMEEVSGQIKTLANRVRTGPGTLHSLIFDDSLYIESRYLLQGAQRNRMLKFFLEKAAKESDKLEREKEKEKEKE